MQLDCWSSVGFAQGRGELYGGVGLGEGFCLYLLGFFLSIRVIFLGSESIEVFYFRFRRGKRKRSLGGVTKAIVLVFRGGKIGFSAVFCLPGFRFWRKIPFFLSSYTFFFLTFLQNWGQVGHGVRYLRLFVGKFREEIE